MIDINSIIHIKNEAFDIEKDIAFLCFQDYQFNNDARKYKFEKDNIYSIAFAKSVGVVVNGFTLNCTFQKDSFKVVEKQDIHIPFIDINKQQETQSQDEIQETQYRFETSGYKQKDGSAFRKNSLYKESEIKEAGLDIQELFDKEAITWLK